MAPQLQTEIQKAVALAPRKILNALAEHDFINSIKSYHLQDNKFCFGTSFSE